MTANDMTVSYPFREILVDKQRALPVQIVNSGANKTPIKQIEILEAKKLGGRFFPTVYEIRSMLVEDKWTHFEIEKINLDAKFPENVFSKEMLEH